MDESPTTLQRGISIVDASQIKSYYFFMMTQNAELAERAALLDEPKQAEDSIILFSSLVPYSIHLPYTLWILFSFVSLVRTYILSRRGLAGAAVIKMAISLEALLRAAAAAAPPTLPRCNIDCIKVPSIHLARLRHQAGSFPFALSF